MLSQFSSVQLLNHLWLFATQWTAAWQTSLSITNSWALLRLMSIESVMSSNHLILCYPLFLPPSIFPSIMVFSNESVHCIRSQSTGVSASASVLPMNIQDWLPLGWTGWIFMQSKELSRVFSNTIVQKYQFFSAQLSNSVEIPLKIANRAALWPSNPTSGHTHWGNQNWKRHVYPNVHCSTVYNS